MKGKKGTGKRILMLLLTAALTLSSLGLHGTAGYAAADTESLGGAEVSGGAENSEGVEVSGGAEAPASTALSEPAAPPEIPGTEMFSVTAKGEHISFDFDREDALYEPGSPVTAVLRPEEGWRLEEESVLLTAEDGQELSFELVKLEEAEASKGFRLSFEMPAGAVFLEASAAKLYELTILCEDETGKPSRNLSAASEAYRYCEGDEVRVTVVNTGENLWNAEVTAGEQELAHELSSEGVSFAMPAGAVKVLFYESESRNQGDLSSEDSSVSGDFQGNQSLTKKENEPDIELGKSARWTDIEDGYAELTITEKDTSDYSNIPTDYIIILDRTRTMSLNDTNHEDARAGGDPNYMGQHSPCINPDHYYFKGGISLYLLDYFTGYDFNNGVWFENLRGGLEFWNRHYNQNGQKIMPAYENGCYDRLSMAKQGIQEMVDRIALENQKVPKGALRSRIAFWSFGDDYRSITGDKRDQGLYNYTALTEDYEKVKRAVGEVKTYSGTYYLASLREAYEIITGRNASDSRRKDVYTKVIFISDGECETDLDEVASLSAKIRSLPNTELFTLAIGMTSESDGAKLLGNMASSSLHTANFWQTLSFSGEKGSAFARTLFNIEKKALEVKAVNKVLTDQIETEYWEPVEVLSADGGLSSAVLDSGTGRLSWKVPEGAGKTFRCTVKLRLKEKYRYLLADALYPTNRDEKGAGMPEIEADPEKAGAVLTYDIDGGMFHQQSRKTGIATPVLKYGTVHFSGTKNWTVEGSFAEQVSVRLMRTLPIQSTAVQVNNAVTNIGRKWAFSFTERRMPDGSRKPLIKYDEQGRAVKYEVEESTPDWYVCLGSRVIEGEADKNGGVLVDTQLYNEPFKIKAKLQKVDEETKNPLSGAVFTVYAWSRKAGKYIPYRGTTNEAGRPYETGTMTGASKAMTLKETDKGTYLTPSWLYYASDNQGKFRIVETGAPEGYYGDWAEGSAVTPDSADEQKRAYDFSISPDLDRNQSVVTVSKDADGTFGNQRVLGKLTFYKKDREAKERIAQGDATLSGAVYRLYAAEDIWHQDKASVLYKKDQEVRVRLRGSRDGVRQYVRDPKGRDALIVGAGFGALVENLELGRYYLKEEAASEGYLVDPAKYEFTLAWKDEKTSVVEIPDFSVREQVKKQSLSFYKMTGTDKEDSFNPLEGAGFSVYLLSEFAGGRYASLSETEAVQAVIDEFRDPVTLDYKALRTQRPAVVYAEAGDEDVMSGSLAKKIVYEDGTAYEADAERKNQYLAAEIYSDAKGILKTPKLPYGRYLVAETTVPEGVIAVRPFVLEILGDDEDESVEGDGKGKPLENQVFLLDRPVMALIRLKKLDAFDRQTVEKEGAAYVIHDIEGKWFDYYTEGWTTARKKAYKERYGDLVAQYSQGTYCGTKENPFTTKWILGEDGSGDAYIDTPSPLPSGLYELEELKAPEGYVLQGHEGVIAKNKNSKVGNQTFYETKETGAWTATPQERSRFSVSSGEAVYDGEAGAFVVEVRQKNEPAIGKIAVYAEGPGVSGARKETLPLGNGGASEQPEGNGSESYQGYAFTYEMEPIVGAEFEIRAAEDIYAPEYRKKESVTEKPGDSGTSGDPEKPGDSGTPENPEASRGRLFKEGELVLTLSTDERGQTWTGQEDAEGTDRAKGLPLGSYYVIQTKAGEGFVLTEENKEPRLLEIAYAGQEVPVIYRNTAYTNPCRYLHPEVLKLDRETKEPLAGAVFGLYAKEELVSGSGKRLVKADTLLRQAVTGTDGKAAFGTLPLGRYYIRELTAPEGYQASREKLELVFDSSDNTKELSDNTKEIQVVKLTVENQPDKVRIEVEKSGPEKAERGKAYSYTLEKIRNAGNCALDRFTLTDVLPDQAELTELQTGTFSGLAKDGSAYEIWYQTNQNAKFRLWKSGLSPKNSTVLLTAELGLAEQERVTSFEYRFGTVERGFTELEKPVYSVQVRENVSCSEVLENVVTLTGDKFGITYTEEDRTLTCLEEPSQPEGSGGGSRPERTDNVPTKDAQRPELYLGLGLTVGAGMLGLVREMRRRKKGKQI